MVSKIIEKWDWIIYRLACGSLRRMCKRNGGFAYLMQLSIQGWLERNPIPENLKRSAEIFHEILEKEQK